MKKTFLAFACILLAASCISQTVFTYGKNAVSKEEFKAWVASKGAKEKQKTEEAAAALEAPVAVH